MTKLRKNLSVRVSYHAYTFSQWLIMSQRINIERGYNIHLHGLGNAAGCLPVPQARSTPIVYVLPVLPPLHNRSAQTDLSSTLHQSYL